MVRLRWSVTIGDDTFEVGRQYNLTLHEMSALSKDLTSWLGRNVSKESNSFDLDTLLDTECRLVVTHHTDSQDRTWARVEGVLPAQAETPLTPEEDQPTGRTEDQDEGLPF